MSAAKKAADVLIAGAGPTGLMLARELRLLGVDVLVLERFAERPPESKAAGIHTRTVEILDQRGMLGPFLAAGRTGPFAHFAGIPLDITRLGTRHPYVLGIPQSIVEPLLEASGVELGVRVARSSEVVGLRQDATGVDVEVRRTDANNAANATNATEWLRADYVVGCDGGRSAVRKLAGIGFPGTMPTMTAIHADVELSDPPAERIFGPAGRREHGSFVVMELQPGVYRVMTFEFDRVAERNAPATFEQLRDACLKIAGTDYGMHAPRWVARFSDASRQADTYRRGRVLLAGDAAHVHFPAGGQGLNLGVQDAVNLGWKLAAAVRGHAPAGLLDSYHAERHPIAERVLVSTRAQTALWRPGAEFDALRQLLEKLIAMEPVNQFMGGMATQLDTRYPMGGEHPLLGRRVPDVDIETRFGAIRLFSLLHTARPVLVDFHESRELRAVADRWAARVDFVEARSNVALWPLPAHDDVAAPAAMLVRPDGHVAWVAPNEGARFERGALDTALSTWFGAPYVSAP